MSAVPENPLEEALVRAKKNPMSRREFYSLLLESDLVVVGRIEGREFSDWDGELCPDEKLQLGRVEYKGLRCVACFTSIARLQAGIDRTTAYVVLNARALFQMTRGLPFILNMGSELAKEFSAEEIDALLDPKNSN